MNRKRILLAVAVVTLAAAAWTPLMRSPASQVATVESVVTTDTVFLYREYIKTVGGSFVDSSTTVHVIQK